MYRLTSAGIIVRISDNAFIPNDPENSDFRAYRRWVDEGNTPEPTEPVQPAVVERVSMRQARLALLGAGLLNDIEAALAAIPDEGHRRAAQIEWEYATEVSRNSPWVQQLSASLGLGGEQLDALFAQAAQL